MKTSLKKTDMKQLFIILILGLMDKIEAKISVYS